MSERLYVAVAGFAKSGKSEIVEYMSQNFGFCVVKPSAIINSELQKENPGQAVFSRAQMRSKGEQLRSLFGAAYYLEWFAAEGQTHILVDGPRHLSSVRAISARGGFTIGVVARPEVRYHRAQQRADKIVPSTIKAFLADERVELNDITGHGGQLLPILWQTAPDDIVDTSDSTLEETIAVVDSILGRHGIERAV